MPTNQPLNASDKSAMTTASPDVNLSLNQQATHALQPGWLATHPLPQPVPHACSPSLLHPAGCPCISQANALKQTPSLNFNTLGWLSTHFPSQHSHAGSPSSDTLGFLVVPFPSQHSYVTLPCARLDIRQSPLQQANLILPRLAGLSFP